MQKIKDIYLNIKSWSLRRKIFFGVLLLIVIIILYKVLAPADNSANTLTDIAKRVDLKETVLATGQVTSETDLSLSFNATGVLKGIKVSVGDSVKKGQILATPPKASTEHSLISLTTPLTACPLLPSFSNASSGCHHGDDVHFLFTDDVATSTLAAQVRGAPGLMRSLPHGISTSFS